MGAWCYLTRQSPDVFLQLSRIERDAFAETAKELRQKGW